MDKVAKIVKKIPDFIKKCRDPKVATQIVLGFFVVKCTANIAKLVQSEVMDHEKKPTLQVIQETIQQLPAVIGYLGYHMDNRNLLIPFLIVYAIFIAMTFIGLLLHLCVLIREELDSSDNDDSSEESFWDAADHPSIKKITWFLWIEILIYLCLFTYLYYKVFQCYREWRPKKSDEIQSQQTTRDD